MFLQNDKSAVRSFRAAVTYAALVQKASLAHLQQVFSACVEAVVAQHVMHLRVGQLTVKHLRHHVQVCCCLVGIAVIAIDDVSQSQHELLLSCFLSKGFKRGLQLAFALSVALWPAVEADCVLGGM